MIFDTFDHYTVYLGLNPALDAALQTLAQQLQQPFDPEKEQLAGGGWFFGTQYGTRARTELKAEALLKQVPFWHICHRIFVIRSLTHAAHFHLPYHSCRR